ncbi:MAG: hypothetical protein HZB66_00180 [Candidatus Aenigmarchaeota archaeon]|nr:hypothetical protein [Candidatus Aenigmarchaeota archaeon]
MKTESFEKPSARGQLNRYEKKLETFSMLGYARHMEILWISNVHGKGCAFSNVLSERFFSAFPSIFRKKEKKPILIKSFSKSSIFIIIILMLVLLSGCIETGHPIVEIDVKYGKHKIYGENNNVVATYEIKKGKNGDDVEIYAENYGHVKINGMKGNPKKMHVQAGLADFNTPIIAVNESVTFEKAEITLMKTGFVNKIFYCSGWNMEQFSCSEWVKTNLSLVANSTHIVFTVDHFTAYAGGVGYESNLTVWDDSDEKAVGENQNVYFYANFTNATSGKPINGTGVNCSIAFGEQKEMRWNATSLLHEYNTSFSAPGTFSWNVTCNGTSLGYDFLNTTDTVLILDTTNPVVNIQLPLNATNMTTQGINFTATDNVAVDKCWYSLGAGNTSLSNCANISSITGEQQGFNRLRVYANDTTGNIGMNEINYTLDSKGPVIKDLTEMPTDPAEYLASQFYEFNATITDAQRAVSSVWIEWNGTNYTSIYNTGSIYSFNRSNLPIASHSYKWYANDSLGNVNVTALQTYIVRDTTPPFVAIQLPQNRSYTNMTMNFTAVDQAFGVCWYSLNRGTTNTSLPSCSNLSSIGTEGFNELWLWANDTTGNENVAKINFTKDLTGPFILLGNPANNSWSASSSNTFYYTPYDNSTIANCTLVIDSAYNQSNASAVSKGTANTMAAGLADGTHLWTVNCTDELGNQGTNTTAKTINIDTITPVVQIVYPQNATYTTTSLHLNFTFTEQNRDSCWYSLNNGANTTITGCANGTAITAMHGHNNITLWMNDSAGNTGSGSVFFVQNNAPGIVNQNATSGATGVISNATNPTNNNTFVRFTAEYSDADSDNATVYICKQDDGNRYGCGQMEQ